MLNEILAVAIGPTGEKYKLDLKFRDEISRLPGGYNLKRCYQCGVCSAGCPVREIDEKYNPRKIIRMIILGMRDRVLSSDFIWLCSQCYTCEERCPQDVRIPEVMDALRNMAVKAGYIQETLAKQVEAVSKLGRLHPISDFENRRRAGLGLPKLTPQNPEAQELFKLTGLDKMLRRK